MEEPRDFHVRQFGVTKKQLAHDLAILKLSTMLTPGEDIDTKDLYEMYLDCWDDALATVEDQTRYELIRQE